jgi:hypothetical protein
MVAEYKNWSDGVVENWSDGCGITGTPASLI